MAFLDAALKRSLKNNIYIHCIFLHMCAFEINDIQSLITQDKPDQGVRL